MTICRLPTSETETQLAQNLIFLATQNEVRYEDVITSLLRAAAIVAAREIIKKTGQSPEEYADQARQMIEAWVQCLSEGDDVGLSFEEDDGDDDDDLPRSRKRRGKHSLTARETAREKLAKLKSNADAAQPST